MPTDTVPQTQPPPVIYWVVGTATNIGKTTVATALIRVLLARGQRALPFKPVAGIKFRNSVELLLEHLPRSTCALFGNDARKLIKASPLTHEGMLDLVVPWQMLYWSDNNDPFIIRTGSSMLKNVRYYKSEFTERLMQRADVQRIVAASGMPVESAELFDTKTTILSLLSPDAISAAFDHLLTLQPDTIVVEGAGPYLPVWQGNPAVNHVLLVSTGEIQLFPDVNQNIARQPDAKMPPSVRQLLPALRQRPSRKTLLEIVGPGLHESAADAALTRLLDDR